MAALEIRFPSGRFHATPWGRHVNEGAPEWPPSPWRILRALVATWKQKLNGDASCNQQVVEVLLQKLVTPPSFALPAATVGHTRHFMPWFKKGPADRTLVFDTFVALDRASAVIVCWPDVVLNEPERTCLDRLAAHLGFLGRAESWVEARLLSDHEAQKLPLNSLPLDGVATDAGFEPIRMLCADPNDAFANKHTPKLESTEGRGKNKTVTFTPVYDPDWHLCLETLQLHNERWADPPGSQWVTYQRARDCFAASTPPRVRPDRPRPTVARFALDATVLPILADTIRVAEAARRTAMGCFRRVEEKRIHGNSVPAAAPLPRSQVFSGKDPQGVRLTGHRHAFYLPTDEDHDGHIDHLTIVAEMGFGPSEVAALDRMRWLKFERTDPIGLVLLALGQEPAINAQALFGPSTTWVSATPFVVTRHPKRNGRRRDPPELLGPENQRLFARQVLLEELERLAQRRPDLPHGFLVEPLNDDHRIGENKLRPIQFKRFRSRRGDDGGRRPAGAFRIVFPEPIRGPLCLGHSSHFGLGLFAACTG